jgi:two-component SAPR family response regulator
MNTIEMLREVGFAALGQGSPAFEKFERLVKLVRDDYSNKHAQLWLKRIDEAVKAEREALLDLVDDYAKNNDELKTAIRARNKE